MKTAKLFTTGRSQAVRLPKDYRFSGKDVFIKKLNGIVMLIPKDDPWASLVRSLDDFSNDFLENRDQQEYQSRELL
jgi:antitoxin VapB